MVCIYVGVFKDFRHENSEFFPITIRFFNYMLQHVSPQFHIYNLHMIWVQIFPESSEKYKKITASSGAVNSTVGRKKKMYTGPRESP